MSKGTKEKPSVTSVTSKQENGETWLGRLGHFIYHRRKAVLISSLLTTILLAIIAAGAMGVMVLNRWEADGSESMHAQEALIEHFNTDSANVILLVTAREGTIDNPLVEEAANSVAAQLAGEASVGDVWSYWSEERDPTMRSEDSTQGLVLAWVQGNATEARAEIATMIPAYTIENEMITVQVAGAEAASTQISASATQDFIRAEMIIIPLMLVLLLFVYRRFMPALLTLGVGLFSVFGTMAALRGLASFVEVATFAANITLVMGIGLGIDYSLFIISRFREELAAGKTVDKAIIHTLETAGKTVIFSGVTVAASLSVLLAFPFSFLQSFGYAGVLVVITAVLGSIIFLPSALAILGAKVSRRVKVKANRTAQVDNAQKGMWYRLGQRVMKRPIWFGGVAVIFLLLLGSPALDIQIGLPDDRVLPSSASTRAAYDEMRANFLEEANDAIHFVAPITSLSAEDLAASAEYASELSKVEGISQVNSIVGYFKDGELVREPGQSAERLVSDTAIRFDAIPTREVLGGTEVGQLVNELRAISAPFPDLVVGGYPAELTDFSEMMMSRVPLVAILILSITFVILFLMSGSILIPLKATILNLLSLSVMFGALVYIFQQGHFSSFLGFTPIGTLDPAFPILMFCVAYGLSMDYEVFMLSRIKEEYDRTGDNTKAVLYGIQRSAPLVSAAAIILAISFSIYATGEIMYLQMLGVGIAIAIIIDATIIRAILVPAFMRIAGKANWWAPPMLRRFHERFGISEGSSIIEPPSLPAQPPVTKAD
ncbi:MMPL family transporter [Bacillus horti]|uniref:RND superfamily putative drug exporter n=1 Tax=Caldalkalibacillus horti TaxID=77523 RepID=A0ABT9VVJ6_9BACI|nr:MMPL family transporter [Bacillus horti]MDQ0164867.1 RND superfamily putative drug exporter [Bacillus horti]